MVLAQGVKKEKEPTLKLFLPSGLQKSTSQDREGWRINMGGTKQKVTNKGITVPSHSGIKAISGDPRRSIVSHSYFPCHIFLLRLDDDLLN